MLYHSYSEYDVELHQEHGPIFRKEKPGMDQLVKMITQRTGISDEQARWAVNTMLEFLKEKLPGPIASQVESLLSGQGSGNTVAEVEKVFGELGSLFGKKA